MNSLEAATLRYEQALIGTALGSPRDASSVTDVRPQDMSIRSHLCLWTAVIELDRRNALTAQAVVEHLHATGEILTLGNDAGEGEITGEMYIEELLSRRSAPSIRDYADRVVGFSMKRQLRDLSYLWALDTESDATDIQELLDRAEEQLYSLRRNKNNSGVDIGDLLSGFEVRMDDWRAGKVKPAFSFTLPGLKRLIPFLEPSDFMLIAGRPGEGKSSVLRYEAFEASQRGTKIAIFNLENSEVEYARYLIAHVTGIDTWKLRDPNLLSPEELAQARAAIRALRSLPLRVISLGAPTVYEIVRTARQLVAEGFQVIMVDYIQLIKNGIENEVQDISMSSSLLRGFALKYNVPMIVASQLNRDITKRENGSRPKLADLRGSGSLEQDAVIAAFTNLVEVDEAFLRRFPQNLEPDGNVIARMVPISL